MIVLRLKGFNGKEIVTEDINVANLTEVKYYNGAWKTWKSSLGKITAKTGGADHFTTADVNETLNWANTTPDSLKIENSAANVSDSAFVKYDMVTLTKNDKGVVTKIQIERSFVGAAGDTFDSVDPATNPAFKAGYKTVTVASGLTGASIGNSAEVYIINKGPAITKTTYGEFAGQVANNSLNKIDFYAGTKTEKVSSLVIDNEDGSALGDQADGATTAEAVISDVKYLDGKVNTLSVITKGGEATYSLFGTDASLKDAFAPGDIVKITVLKDGETVSKIVAPDGGSVAADLSGVSSSSGSVNIWDNTAGTTKYNGLKIQSNAIITKIENNTVSSISLSDLKSLALKKGVRYSLQATGSNEIDSIVVTATDRGSVATELTNVFTAAAAAATGFGKGNTQSITSLTYNSAAVAPAVPDQTTITNVTTKAIYEKGAAVLAAIDIISADYNALSTSNTDKFDLQNASDTIRGYVAATAKLRTAVNAAATTLVVDNSPITNPTAAAKTDEGIWDALPTSVTVVLANGTEKELTISKGVKPSAAVTYTNRTTTMGDWALTAGTHTDATAAEASKTYIFTYVNTNYTFETPITVTVTTPA